MSVETHLLYAIHGPIVAALLVSLLDPIYNPLSRHNVKEIHSSHMAAILVPKKYNTKKTGFWFCFSYIVHPCNSLCSLIMYISAGELILLTKYYKSVGNQVERHTSGRVQHVHEGSESHPDPGSPAGNSVCHFPLEAREPAGWGGLRVHHAHTHALPGRYQADSWA